MVTDVNKVLDPLGNIFIHFSVAEITVDTTGDQT